MGDRVGGHVEVVGQVALGVEVHHEHVQPGAPEDVGQRAHRRGLAGAALLGEDRDRVAHGPTIPRACARVRPTLRMGATRYLLRPRPVARPAERARNPRGGDPAAGSAWPVRPELRARRLRRRLRRASAAPASHEVVCRALHVLEHLEHRGAEGADPDTGDGAGILMQMPDAFLRGEAGFELPPAGPLRRRPVLPAAGQRGGGDAAARGDRRGRGPDVLGWRDVPVDERACGTTARAVRAAHRAAVHRADDSVTDQDALERKLYVIRRLIERANLDDLSIPSFSSRTIVYKGMLTAPQLRATSPTCATSASSAGWRSCTRASPPTPSRAGSSRTRTG